MPPANPPACPAVRPAPLTDEQRELAGQWAPLAFKIANEFARAHPDASRDDAQSLACVVLCRCARGYIPGDVPFKAYAAVSIRRELWSRVPRDSRPFDLTSEPADHEPDALRNRTLDGFPGLCFLKPEHEATIRDHYERGLTLRVMAAARGVCLSVMHDRLTHAVNAARDMLALLGMYTHAETAEATGDAPPEPFDD